MDKINNKLLFSDFLYSIKDIMLDHSITADQALFLLCKFYNIEYDIDISGVTSLYNKGLLVKNNVNATLLFHLKKSTQLTLNIKTDLKPNGTQFTLDRAKRIEKEFVIDSRNSDAERKRVGDKYFKGDQNLARYFIVFKALFPVKNTNINSKWNKKFGFIYNGISLWDDNVRVAKKFIEIYKKLDMGIFLEATYRAVKDSIDIEQEKCFMTKPYKFLIAFDSYYIEVKEDLERKDKKKISVKNTNEKINKLKV